MTPRRLSAIPRPQPHAAPWPRPSARSRSSRATASRSPARTGAYAHGVEPARCSTAALDGLVARTGLAGELVGEVVAGAVLKHSRDWNLTREVVLGSRLDPAHPGVRRPAGVRHRPAGRASLVANKIALGQVDCAIAGGVDTASDAPLALEPEAARGPPRGEPGADDAGQARGARPDPALVPRHRRSRGTAEPRTRMSMGEHAALTAARVGHHPRGPGRARRGQPPQPRRRVRARLLRRPGDAVPAA